MSNPKPKIQTEEEWEIEMLRESLADVLNPDGTFDFDKLRASGNVMTLEELCPEWYDEMTAEADDPA
jgi:hypothetical protein